MANRLLRTAVATALTFALLIGAPSSAWARQPAGACPPSEGSISVPAAPVGWVAVQNVWIGADCQVVRGAIQFLPIAGPHADSNGLSAQTFADVSASIPERVRAAAGGASTQAGDAGGGGGSGCCWKAYSVQRSWDCCNLLMNEYWMELAYNKCTSICSNFIRTYNALDGGKWKGPYWSRNSSDHYLTKTGGGLNYTWVTFEGHQGYSYRGNFDWTGTYFYNSYTTQIRGNVNGTWVCDMSWSWRTTFAGWHAQLWCGTGTYTEK
jgi:hypothetical protein